MLGRSLWRRALDNLHGVNSEFRLSRRELAGDSWMARASERGAYRYGLSSFTVAVMWHCVLLPRYSSSSDREPPLKFLRHFIKDSHVPPLLYICVCAGQPHIDEGSRWLLYCFPARASERINLREGSFSPPVMRARLRSFSGSLAGEVKKLVFRERWEKRRD